VRGNILVAAQDLVLGEQSKLQVVGAGAGGVPEMVHWMAEDEVMWALLRFEFGSGSFKRTKIIFLHFNGESTSTIKRGQANALTKTVSNFFRNGGKDLFHASIQLKQIDEVTLENIINTVSEYFIVDSISGGSTSQMLKEYHEQVAKEQQKLKDAAKDEKERLRAVRMERKAVQIALANEVIEDVQQVVIQAELTSAVEKPGVDSPTPSITKLMSTPNMKPRATMRNPGVLLQLSVESLKQVGNGGLWNWSLVGPDVDKLPMLGGGQGGVDEMRKCAEANQDLVMYGLIRLQFEGSTMLQTRFVMLHIIGEQVPTVRRGRFNAVRPKMEKRFRDFANITAVVPDVAPKDTTLETILDKIGFAASYLTQGGGGEESKVGALRAYQEALIKEQAENAKAIHPKLKPAQALATKVIEEPHTDETATFSLEAAKSFAESLVSGAPSRKTTEDGEAWNPDDDSEDEYSEEEGDETAPHAQMRLEEVNDLIRTTKECNWALVRPRPKAKAAPKAAPQPEAASPPAAFEPPARDAEAAA